jgi:hypothetical protein|tara:strand:- start:1616 stop:2491 length:876 start_codon:yes stop_codon:yes gene_type:complete
MANYSFLNEAKVYIVYGTTKKQLDITSISFSQTFTEETRSVKTLHNQNNMFEGSVINTANPANFEITTNLLIEDASKIVFDRLTDTNSFDLYISTESDVFKLEKCVITNGTINIERLRPLSLSISGQASKLIPGSSVPSGMTLRTASSSRTYNLHSDLFVSLSGTTITDHLVSLSIELQNDIQWIPYKTVNTAAGTRYPTQYTVNGKVLAGNITRYLNDDTESASQSYGTNQSLRIKAGTNIGGLFKGIDFNSNNCSLTQRIQTGSVFTKSSDWRMVQNPASVSGVFTYFT